jgi:uncharacterized membrane protein YheB (UPF0754 family)
LEVREILLPPIIGAFIGYTTNLLAVKMLFKPLKPYYLFGRRVPFTPGVIPAKRERLAKALARVVKEYLINPETLSERLLNPKLKEKVADVLERLIEALAQEIRERDIFLEKVKRRVELAVSEFIEEIVERLSERAAQELLREVVEQEIERRLSLRGGVASGIAKMAVKPLAQMLKEPQVKAKLSKLLWSEFQRAINDRERVEKLKREISNFLLENREEIALRLADEIVKVAYKELPSLLEAIDIESVVVNRINSLPIEEIERLTLALMEEELRHITLLGGLIGFLVGTIQLFI